MHGFQGFFCGEFLSHGDRKKGLMNPTKGFLRFFIKQLPYIDKTNLEVARFSQCVPVSRLNKVGFQKRLTSSPG